MERLPSLNSSEHYIPWYVCPLFLINVDSVCTHYSGPFLGTMSSGIFLVDHQESTIEKVLKINVIDGYGNKILRFQEVFEQIL